MIAYFARHQTAANLLMLAIIALGLSALPELKRETFPEFSASKLQVSVVYPGASTEEAELALCIPMEEAVEGLSDAEQISCESREGISLLTVEMREGGDLSRLLSDVKTQVDAIDNFPSQAEKPIIKELGRDEHLITLALSANLPLFELKSYAENLKDKLQKIPGISIVDIVGFSEQQLRVELSLPQLRQYALSVNDIVSRIEKQNVKLPSGNIESDGKTTLLKFDQQQVTSESLGELVIGSTAVGGEIKLKHLATISERFEKPENKVLFNGKPAALLKIKKNKQQDALDLVDGVYSFVERESAISPEGVEMVLTNDTAQVVKDRLTMLTSNSLQGFILVFATMWLFFAWRYSFWVSMGLPVSFLGAFWIMLQFGVSINMISMVALLMAIGILMDDAIVLAESVAAQVERGKKVIDGVIDGVTMVASGVISSFLTTACIFTGLAFITGDIGQVMKVLPIVLLAVLIVSLVEAFLIMPNHLLHSIESDNSGKMSGFKQSFQSKFERFRKDTLIIWVERFVVNRYFTVGGAIALLLMSFALFSSGILKFKAFPSLEGNTLEMRLLMPQGTALNVTENIATRAADQLIKLNTQLTPEQPDEQSLVSNIIIEFINQDANEDGSHLATVRADLLSAEIRNTNMQQLKHLWREAVGDIPGALSVSFKEPTVGPAGRPFEIRIYGNQLAEVSEASYRIQQGLNQYQGVFDVMDDFRPGKEEWEIQLLPGATAFNVDGATIANQLRAAYFGEVADEFQRDNQTIKIDVRLREQDRRSLRQLQNYPIILADGTQIPLSAIAEIKPGRGYSRINRINGERTVTVLGDIDPNQANTSEVINQLKKDVIADVLADYPNITVSFEGEVKEGGSTGASIVQKFIIGLVGVFIILSFQFRSYFEPIMVMLAIPLASIGAVFGHVLLGYDFTIPSMIGFVSLAGIVVNDSILLVSYIKKHQTEGQSIHDSAINAARERFRAVFITSATTIAGMLPLLLETSLQAQVLQPLVVSLLFGIASSTLLILFVLPSLYCILDDFNLTDKHHLE